MALNPYTAWMVERNLEHARSEGAATVLARLRANGYHHVADLVEEALMSR